MGKIMYSNEQDPEYSIRGEHHGGDVSMPLVQNPFQAVTRHQSLSLCHYATTMTRLLLSQCGFDCIRASSCTSSKDCCIAELLSQILEPLVMLVMVSMLSFYNTQGQNTGLHGDGEGELDDLGLSHSEHPARLSEVEVLYRPYCKEAV